MNMDPEQRLDYVEARLRELARKLKHANSTWSKRKYTLMIAELACEELARINQILDALVAELSGKDDGKE